MDPADRLALVWSLYRPMPRHLRIVLAAPALWGLVATATATAAEPAGPATAPRVFAGGVAGVAALADPAASTRFHSAGGGLYLHNNGWAALSPAQKQGVVRNIGARGEELLLLDNGTVKVGIDGAKGAAITWLSWAGYPKNTVNSADPGRLIQQSYYAGLRLDRRAEGQSKAWSPWSWNPIQGGGVASWARVTVFKRLDETTLYAETIPNLWDMPSEPAAALMRQWTAFEPAMPDVVVVHCEFNARREPGDRWGPARPAPQEIPACYFTRNFSTVKSYLGDGRWRVEEQPPGPPWGRTRPPRHAMALFAPGGEGVAVFSPAATEPWNFGPHGGGASDDPAAGPCVHVAPIDRVNLGPRSTYRYRYWLLVGTEARIAARLDELGKKYSGERAELANP